MQIALKLRLCSNISLIDAQGNKCLSNGSINLTTKIRTFKTKIEILVVALSLAIGYTIRMHLCQRSR